MPRIRSIKPEFWADEALARLPRDARLLFIGLWNFADDSGRLRGSVALIRAQVFPYDPDVDVDALLQNLADGGFIQRYEADEQSFIWVGNFNKHQKIDKPSKSQLPEPPRTVAEHSPKPRGALAVGREGKGEEGNGAGRGAEGAADTLRQVAIPTADPWPRDAYLKAQKLLGVDDLDPTWQRFIGDCIREEHSVAARAAGVEQLAREGKKPGEAGPGLLLAIIRRIAKAQAKSGMNGSQVEPAALTRWQKAGFKTEAEYHTKVREIAEARGGSDEAYAEAVHEVTKHAG